MDARFFRGLAVCAALASAGAGYRTPNFVVVQAPTAELAREVGDTAERLRRELAVEWVGEALPNWSRPCPISAKISPQLGAGGATSFVFHHGEVFDWNMNVQGTRERVLDSVLPHEITHTIFASHFRQPLPRWADEGACTTVEHVSERDKQERMLIDFLQTGRGIAFAHMFAMREYPQDILPLYAQGYALARYLIDQGGKRKFVDYVGQGLASEDWAGATQQFYGYNGLGQLQNQWLDWVRSGSPLNSTPDAPLQGDNQILLANATGPTEAEPAIYRGQQRGRLAEAFGKIMPGGRKRSPAAPPADPGIPGWEEPPAQLPAGAVSQAMPLTAAPGQPLPNQPPTVQLGVPDVAPQSYAAPQLAAGGSHAYGQPATPAAATADHGWHPSVQGEPAPGRANVGATAAPTGSSIYASGALAGDPPAQRGGGDRQIVLEWSRMEELAAQQRSAAAHGDALRTARGPVYDASRETGAIRR